MVIGDNGETLDLKDFAVLPVALSSTLIWHEFGVVPNLPLEVLVGADVLAPLSALSYILGITRSDTYSEFKYALGAFSTAATPRSNRKSS